MPLSHLIWHHQLNKGPIARETIIINYHHNSFLYFGEKSAFFRVLGDSSLFIIVLITECICRMIQPMTITTTAIIGIGTSGLSTSLTSEQQTADLYWPEIACIPIVRADTS
jgi:hypothetical protein